MKLIIQIPAHNEEETLPSVLAELPRQLDGVSQIEWLVIDDGSLDRTAAVAREGGADHVLRFPIRHGLARVFAAGLAESVRLGADIIVNTDADRQYRAEDIPRLIQPILDGRAAIVIGARPLDATPSIIKRQFSRFGSLITRWASGTNVGDAASGFRAFSRQAALRLHVYGSYTYTVETIIQAGRQGMTVESVPVGVNPVARPSRLMRGIGRYMARQSLTMLRVFVVYKPFRFFAICGAIAFACGAAIGTRFLYFYVGGDGGGHVQSLILAALLMGTGVALVLVGLVADLLAVNRTLLESLDTRLRLLEDRLRSSE